jgi:predicted dehydrogenase
MMSEALGVAVVGIGGVAQNHLAAVDAVPEARLVALCDTDAGRAREAARQRDGVRWTADIHELAGWSDVDGVIVCTPNATHEEVALPLASARKHLLVEKPLALTLESADRLIAAARTAGTVLMPAHTHRFYDYGMDVRSAIAAGAVGRPGYARLTALAGWIWGSWASWVLDPSRSGGHVLHNGVHGIDLVLWWLGGRPVEVSATGHRLTHERLPIWDAFHVGIRCEGGAVGSVEFSRGSRPRAALLREVVVAGEDGVLAVGGEGWGGEIVVEGQASAVGFDVDLGFRRQLAAWVRACRREEPAAVSAADGRTAVAVALAAERSIALARPVGVDA